MAKFSTAWVEEAKSRAVRWQYGWGGGPLCPFVLFLTGWVGTCMGRYGLDVGCASGGVEGLQVCAARWVGGGGCVLGRRHLPRAGGDVGCRCLWTAAPSIHIYFVNNAGGVALSRWAWWVLATHIHVPRIEMGGAAFA